MRVPASLALAGLVLLTGCGSIIKGSSHDIAFTSTPTQANISIVDEDGTQVYNGRTPATVTLNKKRLKLNKIICKQPKDEWIKH